MIREISLLNSTRKIVVDEDSYSRIISWNWRLNRTKTGDTIRGWTGSQEVPIANYIMDKYDVIYDHIDKDPFNNQKSNYRVASLQQNLWNRKKYKTGKSKFKGVYWNKVLNSWYAQISVNGKTKYLGLCDTEQKAALAYNNFAKNYHGEFACLNQL